MIRDKIKAEWVNAGRECQTYLLHYMSAVKNAAGKRGF